MFVYYTGFRKNFSKNFSLNFSLNFSRAFMYIIRASSVAVYYTSCWGVADFRILYGVRQFSKVRILYQLRGQAKFRILYGDSARAVYYTAAGSSKNFVYYTSPSNAAKPFGILYRGYNIPSVVRARRILYTNRSQVVDVYYTSNGQKGQKNKGGEIRP